MIEISLIGETPAKKNSRIINTKTGRSFPSKRYSEWHKNAIFQIVHQTRNIQQIKVPCVISMTFVHGDLRRRDSDNGLSSVLDLLVDCGILEDDNWKIIKKITVLNGYEKNNARCEIKIDTL